MGVESTAFALAFEISPIMLVGGIAASISGGVLPIATFTEGLSLLNGLIDTGGIAISNFTTRFFPEPGTTLIMQDVGEYPFFNQATAANAVLQRPNRIVMRMLKPITTDNGGYFGKILSFTSLKMALDTHNQAGGTYTILTPSYIYTGCLMRAMTDVSSFSEQNKQPQYCWTFEFEQPLLYVSQLEAVLGNLMSKFDSGVPSTSELSW